MDVFERVREVNRGAGLTEERIAASRARLLTALDSATTTERKRIARRPMFVIAGAVTGVAAVAAGVVVVSQLSMPTPRVEAVPQETVRPTPEPSPTPLPSVTSGTTVTEPFPGTTPQAGQYLRIETSVDSLMYRDAQGSLFTWNGKQDTAPPVSAATVRDLSETSIPADRSAEWSGSFGPGLILVQVFPSGQGVAEEQTWKELLPQNDAVQSWRAMGGFDSHDLPRRGSTEYFAQFPRDPAALLDFAKTFERGYQQTPQQADEAAVDAIMTVLRSNAAPTDLRVALLEALALSPVTEITSTSGGITTYLTRFQHMDKRTDTISIDDATGWMTAYTLRYDRSGGDFVPAGVPDIRFTSDVSIVDARP